MPAPMPPDNTGKKYKRTVEDPRVSMFKQFYLSPTSTTFMNILQSAIRAGYSEQYANNISVQKPGWWVELQEGGDYRRAKMLDKAEARLHERLADEDTDDNNKMKLQVDVAKFVSERLGKSHYSTRQEVTGADGRRLFDNETREESAVDLQNLFAGVKDAT